MCDLMCLAGVIVIVIVLSLSSLLADTVLVHAQSDGVHISSCPFQIEDGGNLQLAPHLTWHLRCKRCVRCLLD